MRIALICNENWWLWPMVLKRQSVMTNEKQREIERREREMRARWTQCFFFFTAQGAKHAGKCLESMVSADPKALIHHKAHIRMDPLNPGQLYTH